MHLHETQVVGGAMKQQQLIAIAVACGILCAACIGLFMTSVQGEAEAARAEALARYGGEQVEVCVATRNIVAGERLDLSAVETKLWVADLLPEGAVRASSDAVGKTATSSIFKGEVILSGRFETGHDSLDVPSGKQAVSVPAKAVQAVGGAISPGMSVDIYALGDTTTSVIAKDVSVLDTSVGKSGSLMSSENGWITLAVDPENVQEIIAASGKTTLYFTLPGATVENGDAADSQAAKDNEPDASSQSSSKKKSKAKDGNTSSDDSEDASKSAASSSNEPSSATSNSASNSNDSNSKEEG
jgi:pilus assembly protein CpaB